MSKVIHLTEENFDEIINKGVSLVDFFAEWCGPCKMVAPVIEELANEYTGKANICKVDIDTAETIAAKYGIRSVPTIFIFKNGEIVETVVGFRGKVDLIKLLDANL